MDPTANYTDPDLQSHNALVDQGLCSLLVVISRTNNKDPDLLVHYVTADQGQCYLQLDLTYKQVHMVFINKTKSNGRNAGHIPQG